MPFHSDLVGGCFSVVGGLIHEQGVDGRVSRMRGSSIVATENSTSLCRFCTVAAQEHIIEVCKELSILPPSQKH